eukprot:CAMPEP_0178516034 /NCGR_PEP_ID=MMETSP0696-20121128/24883_1 /TAXON_ID=265572 /ORGANISM="Extubocellulus spinifer, Strain CCMP396" /LENGTH=80 /DNA_ID=CAMNT_0020146253 /DNA_START=6 /DNA_END=248 /DNA_ORIENTATION=+
MSSGFGLRGGIGRCYPFWAEYKECLKTEERNDGGICMPSREDYFECLHNRREHEIVRAVNAEEKKQKEGGGSGGHGGGGE